MPVIIQKMEKAPFLRDSMRAKVKTAGNVTEVLVSTSSTKSEGCPCRRISADEYIDERSGEVGRYEHQENRAENARSFYRSLNQIRDLINANVTVAEYCRFLTLTYAENMTDRERLYRDFKAFWKRFCRWCHRQGISKPEYLAVIEPQGRGAWHLHVVLIWQEKAPFINNNEVLESLWGHGFTSCKAVYGSVDNIGAYFGAYLTDIPLDEYKEIYGKSPATEDIKEADFITATGEKKTKKFVKGARAKLYPSGMNIFRHSRGLVQPVTEEMTYEEAKKKVTGATATFQTAYSVSYDSGETITQYVRLHFNTAKVNKQAQVKDEEKRVSAAEREKEELRALAEEILHQKPKPEKITSITAPRIVQKQLFSEKGERLAVCKDCGLEARLDLFQMYGSREGICIPCAKERKRKQDEEKKKREEERKKREAGALC